jgi:MFS family permease
LAAAHSGRAPGHDPLAALRQPAFVLYSSSRVGSALGQSIMQAVLAWQVWDLTGSALNLGLLGLARFFPSLGASLIGGAVADAYDRRLVIVISKSVPLLAAAVLAGSTWGGWISMEVILALVVMMGFAAAFENPARVALLPAIVKPETFENAVTVANTMQRLATVTGPTLGGVIIAAAGSGTGYAVFGATIIVSVIPLLMLRYRQPPTAGQRVSVAAIKEGVAFVRNRQVLLGAMTLDMFAVIFGGAQALLPVYADEILKVGPTGYGVLSSAMQVGAFAMSLLLVLRPPVQRTGRALIYTVIAFGLVTVAFGLSRDYMLSILLYALIGAVDQVSVVMRQTTIQMATPDELRGRVSSVNQVFVGASNQIGAMRAGFVAAVTGATFAVWSGGLISVAVALIVAWKMPQLFNYEIPRAHTTTSAPAPEITSSSNSDAPPEEPADATVPPARPPST